MHKNIVHLKNYKRSCIIFKCKLHMQQDNNYLHESLDLQVAVTQVKQV